MNIWVVNHYAIPPGRAGGTRHFTFARELQKRGHKVTIIASSFDHYVRQEVRLREGETYRLEEVDGVPFFWIRTPPYSGNSPARVWNMVAFALRLLGTANPALLGKPDVVWGSSPHLFAALAAERLARRCRTPFVLEVRDLWPQTLIDLGGFSPCHPFIQVLQTIERYLYRRSDRIISLLPLAHLHMAEKGADPAKIAWIPNGVDLSLVPPPTPPPPRADGVFTVMYAGAHGLANNLDLIVKAAAIVARKGWNSRIQFRLVGDGPEKPRLKQMAQEWGLENIWFEDAIPKQEVYNVLFSADAFVISLKDSRLFRWGVSPNKLFDYMASARPVIFAVATDSNPVADAGAGITVPPNDPAALAEAVIQLAQMSAHERWEMGLRGRRYVEEKHAFHRLTDKLEEVLESASRT